jgi:hypothetical protein
VRSVITARRAANDIRLERIDRNRNYLPVAPAMKIKRRSCLSQMSFG